ncbi:immunoglobulin domain and leucine-rich repeat-containing protein 2-like [Dreissena polymorpha]|uniref:Ig-like domain-containing protein n=1 Tax=Dreissena polymorpha TaxID=45954 RepID=A0A9D4QPM6_DREPO|nr:immunoglobulin domain and leucine-rich repeat-containing protein 2-like [Dreissena polymorpha]KAH3837780.1 hypothetical protein DPMN_111181 [Dreissena polymorpha]
MSSTRASLRHPSEIMGRPSKVMAQSVRMVTPFIACLLVCAHATASMACPEGCECIINNLSSHVTCADQSLTSIPEGIPSNITDIRLRGNKISNISSVFHIFTGLVTADISLNNIQSVHSNDLFRNNHLKELILSNNKITTLNAEAFINVPNLLVINLSNNNICVLKSAIFHNLFSLKVIDLRNNSIQLLEADAFTNLTDLQSLDLSYNQITTIPDELFRDMNKLKSLNLQQNRITAFNGEGLFSATNSLEYLDLSFNLLENVTKSDLTFQALTHLDLAGNNISQFTSDLFHQLDNLTVLVLDGNPISSISTAVFEHLSSLRNLTISYLKSLTYLSPNTFKGLSSLECLELNNNPLLSFIHPELFAPLTSIRTLDLSLNNITNLQNASFEHNSGLSILDIQGNTLPCDCSIDWIIEEIQMNSSFLRGAQSLSCANTSSSDTILITALNLEILHCSDVTIMAHTSDSSFRVGRPAILKCVASSDPSPEITWITPRNLVLKYHDFHPLSSLSYLPLNDTAVHKAFHSTHDWHEQPHYFPESETHPDRIVILEDGSLYIDYVMRMDGGPYKCIASNPRNSSEVTITVFLDYDVLRDVYHWSLVIGLSCAGAFFCLNLTYSLTLAGVRKCISQQRRVRVRHMIETIDKYKTARLGSIKENYNNQVGKIRDQYHFQLGRLREHHQNQVNRMGRMREGATLRMEKLKENYNNQLGRLKDYSSSQLVQLRERYNSQVDKIKDYGNDKLDRIHEKYKIKQQHVIKLFEMMNLENCRTAFDSECVRAESMILQSEPFTEDVPLHSPIDSVSMSESEYMTATSSESSRYASQEDVQSRIHEHDLEMVPLKKHQQEYEHQCTSSGSTTLPDSRGHTDLCDENLPSVSYTAKNRLTDSPYQKRLKHNRDRMRLPLNNGSTEETRRLYRPDCDIDTQPPTRRVNSEYYSDFLQRSQHAGEEVDHIDWETKSCTSVPVQEKSSNNSGQKCSATDIHVTEKADNNAGPGTNRHSDVGQRGGLVLSGCIIKESVV